MIFFEILIFKNFKKKKKEKKPPDFYTVVQVDSQKLRRICF